MSYHSDLTVVTQIKIFYDTITANEFMVHVEVIDVKFTSPETPGYRIMVIYKKWIRGKDNEG